MTTVSRRYASVRRFVAQLRGATPEARVVIPTTPGEEGQVDYGDGPMVRWPETKMPAARDCFSSRSRALAEGGAAAHVEVERADWCELHERAFRRLGGTPAVVVLDNLKEGVLTPDIYDPALNPLYRDVLAHYGTVALPCRVGDPDRKGKVESGIGHTQRTPLKASASRRSRRPAYLDRWDAHWADTRIHGTTKRQVAAMFAEERPTLRPLPVEPFRYYRFGDRTVHLDGCVEVEAAFYGAPPGWIGRRVHVQWNDLHVRAHRPEDASAPARASARHGVSPDRRSRPAARTPPTTLALLGRAATAGASIGAVCRHMRRAPPTVSANSSACSPWRRNTAWPSSKTPPRRRSRSASRRIASSQIRRPAAAAAAHAARRSAHPATDALSRPHRPENRRL